MRIFGGDRENNTMEGTTLNGKNFKSISMV
jgi:hypothetical protein